MTDGAARSEERFLCLHGHFYQPPRENPWLEDVEVQDSAYPFHNWNERITQECYGPNTSSRLLDADRRIRDIVNNYSLMSFNFGPTLLAWLERRAPDVHQAIVDSDHHSVHARGGHGNALAQVYNHMIMPLASRRDKLTQIRWGVADFRRRFGRRPEGMWLAETAVDSETLELLVDEGIRFTLLAPGQAKRIQHPQDQADHWVDVSGGRVDPSQAYRWQGPRGLSMALFFYDAPISHAIAFEGLLHNGEDFARRLLTGFSSERRRPQLVSIATDGESYGHHHRFGDMALAYALKKIAGEGSARLTNYAEFLALHPPTWTVEVHENSSWSCAHGVERWRSDCGCRLGMGHGWNQRWRAPLRETLDQLRDKLDILFESEAASLLKDPWVARDNYIDVINDRSPQSIENFFSRHQARGLTQDDKVRVLKLLEMQRHRLLMYTSCAWFFDEISGLESVAVLQFAARAVQLAETFPKGNGLEAMLLEGLARAPSNIEEYGNGAEVYRRFVKPAMANLSRVAAHQAIQKLFHDPGPSGKAYCYSFRHLDSRQETQDGASLVVGKLWVQSDITWESIKTDYAVMHLGGHDVQGLQTEFPDEESYRRARDQVAELFLGGDYTGVMRLLAQTYAPEVYTLQDTFLEDRRHILQSVTQEILDRHEETYRHLVSENRSLINYLRSVNFPIPSAFRLSLLFVLERDVALAVRQWDKDSRIADKILAVRKESDRFGLTLDWTPVIRTLEKRLRKKMRRLLETEDPSVARALLEDLKFLHQTGFEPSLWLVENLFYAFRLRRQKKGEGWPLRPRPGEESFAQLGEALRFIPEGG